MSWNAQRIDDVARKSASVDYGAFEAIGLSEMPSVRVLDVGCFDGYNTVLKFAPYRNLAEIVGIDPCADAVKQACGRTNDARFRWEVSSVEEYAASDSSFDVAYFSHSFQHVRDKEQTLCNVFRMLKPGGFVVMKTIDDSLMISSPDPCHIVSQATHFYASAVLPFCAHTAHTDRFVGQKCPTLLLGTGFSAVKMKVLYTDTLGKTAKERASLFERLTYFRRNVASEAGQETAARMHDLLDKWEQLFSDELYYFAMPSVVVLARKPFLQAAVLPEKGALPDAAATLSGAEASSGEENSPKAVLKEKPSAEIVSLERKVLPEMVLDDYKGPWFDDSRLPCELARIGNGKQWVVRQMTEADLGDVMEIESAAFPNPWTPLAYALELRYNRSASYMVARDATGVLCGYVGVWRMAKVACITRVAVNPRARRKGLGFALVRFACSQACALGCAQMRLTVRASNEPARAFYRKLGFAECGASVRYYTDPDEDGVVMVLDLACEK